MTDTDWSRLSVLVVDDVSFVRAFVGRLLDGLGITRVVEATDGADGLAKLATFEPDLVVLDIMMKPVNGLQFLKTVRMGLAEAPYDLPIVVLTGATDTPVMGTAMALDCDAFLSKSARADTIRERIARVLADKAASRSPEHYHTVALPDVDAPPAEVGRASGPPPNAAVELAIHDVPVGAIAARDVVTNEGTVLVLEGTPLTASHLARLGDLAEFVDIHSIWVRRAD